MAEYHSELFSKAPHPLILIYPKAIQSIHYSSSADHKSNISYLPEIKDTDYVSQSKVLFSWVNYFFRG
jgi:hypothetical protein